jgi:hypothetical protein
MPDRVKLDQWPQWRPSRRYYLWRYRSDSPALITLVLPTKAVDLNETASLVWESIDGNRPVLRIIEMLAEKYPSIARAKLGRDVLRLLLSLENEKLIYLLWEPL